MSGLADSFCCSLASFHEIIGHNAALFDHGWHVHCILPSGWGNRQHFSTGTTTRHSDGAEEASGTSLFNKCSEAAWVSVPTQCFVCPTIHYEWKVSKKRSFLRAMITACACAGMRVLLCLPWLDTLLSLPSTSAKEIVRWVLKWKATDNDHDIFWHFIFLCDVTHWSSWQFVIMPVHRSSSVQRPLCVNKLNQDLLYMVLSETENCSLCVKILLIL